MLSSRGTHGLCRIRGLLYAIGGNGSKYFGETYDIAAPKWTFEPEENHPNYGKFTYVNSNTHIAARNDTTIYI
jgi:hypothetical protein